MKKVLRFTAPWCQPCKTLAKMLTEINSPIPIEVVDIEEKPDLAAQYKIRSVPTMVITENDVELSRLTGTQQKDKIQAWLG